MRKKIDLIDEVDKQVAENAQEVVQNELGQLKVLVQLYGHNKAQLDEIKKVCDSQNNQIKDVMSKYNISEEESEDFKVSYSVQHRESLDEDKLLSLFTSVPAFIKYADQYNIVRTREYIDMDALESLLYKEELADELTTELDKCRESKDIPTLRISKKKKGKK